jgi:hypothetical protein
MIVANQCVNANRQNDWREATAENAEMAKNPKDLPALYAIFAVESESSRLGTKRPFSRGEFQSARAAKVPS